MNNMVQAQLLANERTEEGPITERQDTAELSHYDASIADEERAPQSNWFVSTLIC